MFDAVSSHSLYLFAICRLILVLGVYVCLGFSFFLCCTFSVLIGVRMSEERIHVERELGPFLDEILHFTSNHQHHFDPQMLKSVTNVDPCCNGGGFCVSDRGSSSLASFDFDRVANQTPETHKLDRVLMNSSVNDCWYRGKNNEFLGDVLGLAREVEGMCIGNRTNVYSDVRQFEKDPSVFRISDRNLANFGSINGENLGCFDGLTNDFLPNRGFQTPVYGLNMGVDDGMKFGLGQRGCNVDDSVGHFVAQSQSNGLLFNEMNQRGNEYCGIRIPMRQINECYSDGNMHQRGKDCYVDEISLRKYGTHFANPPLQPHIMDVKTNNEVSKSPSPYLNEVALQECGMNFNEKTGVLNLIKASQTLHSKQAFGMESVLYDSVREKTRGPAQSVVLMKKTRQPETYDRDDTFIIQENSLGSAIPMNDLSRGRNKRCLSWNTMQNIRDRSLEHNGQLQQDNISGDVRSLLSYYPMLLQQTCNSLAGVQDSIYPMAKDQHGCRSLQKKFDEGSYEDVQLIFSEIIDHIVELMMNPFGNYLIQKLLDVCNEKQRMKIVQMVTRDHGQLVKVSLDTHGTRVVQKLIETLKTRRQISLVIQALEPGFLDLIKDPNGNHVVQRCLQCLSCEDNKFIFDAAAKFCVEIATHRHGCCVLQRCIAHSKGEQQQNLVAEISSYGVHLAQDPFGNYVVQYLIELKDPSTSSKLVSQFEGNYMQLSMQKFSSHVVERCLKCIEESRPRIVYELLSVEHFDQLLQHPFANYVIQSALEVTKGALHDSLVAAVRPHTMLRTNPHCKKIFSRSLLKK